MNDRIRLATTTTDASFISDIDLLADKSTVENITTNPY